MDFRIPDNYINLRKYHNKEMDFEKESKDFLDIINQSKKENDIQQYIKEQNKWFIPGSIIFNYDFSSVNSFLVPEQALGVEYRADYMLIGQNSAGIQIVLVEFENANVSYKLQYANTEAEPVRKGLTQIRDWRRWMDDNRDYFLKSSGLIQLTHNLRLSSINYCLVVSRRKYMDDLTNQMRGQTKREIPELRIITFDRLVDDIKYFAKY